MANAMKSLAVGRVRDKGKTWFPELSDKRASTKRHVYWSMANCNGDPATLRVLIENIAAHYQVHLHFSCTYSVWKL